MATEFKKLSEVTTLEEAAETAYVLIEENGEIYRVPKTAVGGAGGYMMITLTEDNSYIDHYMLNCNVNYDEMYEALLTGTSVWLDLSEALGYPFGAMVVWFSLTSGGLEAGIADNQGILMGGCVLFPNGSHNLPSDER